MEKALSKEGESPPPVVAPPDETPPSVDAYEQFKCWQDSEVFEIFFNGQGLNNSASSSIRVVDRLL